MNITDYKIVPDDCGGIDRAVQAEIKCGWQPFGSPFVHDGKVHQAMVIYGPKSDTAAFAELIRQDKAAALAASSRQSVSA